MPIFSNLAISKEGAGETMCAELSALDHCQVIPADNQDVVVLVTDIHTKRIVKMECFDIPDNSREFGNYGFTLSDCW